MRKTLVIVIAAVALFAVGAFAAQIATVNGEDIASGTDEIDACSGAGAVEVDWNIGEYDDGIDDWEVVSVTVNTPASCNGAEVEVVVSDAADDAIDTSASGTIAGGTSGALLFSDDTVYVGAVENVDVVLEGLGLSAPSPSL